MKKEGGDNQRPTILTVICVLGFIAISLGILSMIALIIDISTSSQIFPADLVNISLPNALFALLLASISLVSLIGIWLMRKWGAISYIIIGLVSYAHSIWMNGFSFGISHVISLVIIFFLIYYFKRMR